MHVCLEIRNLSSPVELDISLVRYSHSRDIDQPSIILFIISKHLTNSMKSLIRLKTENGGRLGILIPGAK